MPAPQELKPAREMARSSHRFPNESAAYREARTSLLAEEIELRRHIERVAAQRRALPRGGVVPENYAFGGESGPVTFSQLFGPKDTLITYNWMFGASRKRPCSMCTSMLSALDGELPDICQQVAFAVIASSPIERLLAFKKERGWRYLKLASSGRNNFNRDYAGEVLGGDDHPAFNVFMRSNGVIHHFWGDEMGAATADPDQDPRGAPEMMPLWNILDLTPHGRSHGWYPELEYPKT